MLESRNIWPQIAARIRRGPAGSCVDGYLTQLASDGYSTHGIRRHLQAVDRFGCWLAAQGLQLSDVDERTVEHFVADVPRIPSVRCRGGRLSSIASGARRFAHFNWHESHVRILGAKTGTERALPISDEVGNAVADYLAARGAVVSSRALFLRATPPRHQSLSPSAVSCIAHHALRRAGIEIKRSGAHVFRHSAATNMVRHGAAYKQVADVLGHVSLETTAIYAKLDVNTLARVALPWPEGER